MHRDDNRSARRRGGFAVALATLVLAASGCAASDDESPGDYATSPERSAEGRERFTFDNLESMTAQSDLVLRARVAEIAVGKTYGESADDQFTTRNVTLTPVEVLKGTAGTSVLLEEEGWDADREGYVMNGVLWSKRGDEAWYFLRKSDSGSYRLIASYGRYAISSAKKGPSGHHPSEEGPWSALPDQALGDPQAAANAIRAAAKAAAR